MTEIDEVPYYGLFRMLSELNNSCSEAKEEVNAALEQLDSISRHIKSLDTMLMQKYNMEVGDKVQRK
jgi:hypothetical protein